MIKINWENVMPVVVSLHNEQVGFTPPWGIHMGGDTTASSSNSHPHHLLYPIDCTSNLDLVKHSQSNGNVIRIDKGGRAFVRR